MNYKSYLLVAGFALFATVLGACGATSVEALAQTGSAPAIAVVSGEDVSLPSNTEAQSVTNSLNQGGPGNGGADLTAAAETLGVTVEELQQALQDARPAECADQTQPVEGVDCRPDLDAVAQALGVTTEELQAAMGGSHGGGEGQHDLTTAAETLGVTVEELQQALQAARPAECAAPTDGTDQSKQPGDAQNCRPDLNAVAEALGVTVEELQTALGGPSGPQGNDNLDAVAESLGITVEELQQALQDARPAECTDQTTQPGNGVDCRPDLDAVAESLGITAEELQTALEENRPDGHNLDTASETLGVTTEELQQALQDARPAECSDPSAQPANGTDCRPDLEAVAQALGVTVEELQATLGHPGNDQGNGQQGGPGNDNSGNGGPGNGGPGNGGPGNGGGPGNPKP